jgi:hypothetical protein
VGDHLTGGNTAGIAYGFNQFRIADPGHGPGDNGILDAKEFPAPKPIFKFFERFHWVILTENNVNVKSYSRENAAGERKINKKKILVLVFQNK